MKIRLQDVIHSKNDIRRFMFVSDGKIYVDYDKKDAVIFDTEKDRPQDETTWERAYYEEKQKNDELMKQIDSTRQVIYVNEIEGGKRSE